MLNVVLYHCNLIPKQDQVQSTQLYVSVATLYLKTYVDLTRPEVASQLNWHLPIQHAMTDQELIDYCWDNEIDVLGLSLFHWSYDYIRDQMLRVRHSLPPRTRVVAGGGHVIPHSDPDFLQKHSWIDYAVYGAGEVAFADIAESIINQQPLIRFNTSNVAWRRGEQNQSVTADFRYVPEPKVSPYLHCQDLLTAMVQQEQQRGYEVELPYQVTRGCPYKCTFCDWNNGPSNKTTRRRGTYQDEIDLFYQLGIKKIDIADANTGQYPEDVEMFKYFALKNLEHNAGFVLNFNLSKIKKEVNLELLTIAARANLLEGRGFVLAVQDIHPEILDNIDRPDVTWDAHKHMIDQLQAEFPHLPVMVQLIQGLPGQTLASWQQTLIEVTKTGAQMYVYINEFLTMSPANLDPTYARFKMKYSESQRFSGEYYYRNKFPESCASFDARDMVEMTMLSHLMVSVGTLQFNLGIQIDIDSLVEEFQHSQSYHDMCEDLLDNWCNNNQFWFRKAYGGIAVKNDVMTACRFDDAFHRWYYNPNVMRMIISHVVDLKKHWPILYKYCKDNAISQSATSQDHALAC